MTVREWLADKGRTYPLTNLIGQCAVCSAVARLNTNNGMGLPMCRPCESEHFYHLSRGDSHE